MKRKAAEEVTGPLARPLKKQTLWNFHRKNFAQTEGI